MAGGLCLAVVLCCPPLSPYFCLALEPPSLLSIRLLPLQNQFPAVTGSPEKRNPPLGQLSLPYPRVSRRGQTRPPSHPGRERSAASCARNHFLLLLRRSKQARFHGDRSVSSQWVLNRLLARFH